MSIRAVLMSCLLPLAACEGGLDAYGQNRETGDAGDQGWWWLLPSSDEEEPEPAGPTEPGDPQWFDAHCADGACVVPVGFDPRDHLWRAAELCAAETPVALGFEMVWFETERVYADDFSASAASWTYRFSAPDPDDLWGYRWIRCEVDVTGQTVELDDMFAPDSRRVVGVDALQQAAVYGIDHALEDIGAFSHVTRGGLQWRIGVAEPEIFLADDEWNDWDRWNATTGERDW